MRHPPSGGSRRLRTRPWPGCNPCCQRPAASPADHYASRIPGHSRGAGQEVAQGRRTPIPQPLPVTTDNARSKPSQPTKETSPCSPPACPAPDTTRSRPAGGSTLSKITRISTPSTIHERARTRHRPASGYHDQATRSWRDGADPTGAGPAPITHRPMSTGPRQPQRLRGRTIVIFGVVIRVIPQVPRRRGRRVRPGSRRRRPGADDCIHHMADVSCRLPLARSGSYTRDPHER
jgi:hypothetical protein